MTLQTSVGASTAERLNALKTIESKFVKLLLSFNTVRWLRVFGRFVDENDEIAQCAAEDEDYQRLVAVHLGFEIFDVSRALINFLQDAERLSKAKTASRSTSAAVKKNLDQQLVEANDKRRESYAVLRYEEKRTT